MLDLLLQRADDLPLWEGADLAYVVLDEFHTYDGAQGTDVAMLLRRLGRRARAWPRPDRPLGPICPVATSATLGEGGDGDGGDGASGRSPSRSSARRSTRTRVVGEDRLRAERVHRRQSTSRLPLPDPAGAGRASPTRPGTRERMDRIAEAVTRRARPRPGRSWAGCCASTS